MFDLEQAITTWSNTCSSDPAVSNDHRNELETHLRDSIARLREQGNLSEEEAFLISGHRLGHPIDLQQEYQKVHLGETWRHRTLLMVSGYLLISLALKIIMAEQSFVGWLGLTLGLGPTNSVNHLTGMPHHWSALLATVTRIIGLGGMTWFMLVLARGPQARFPAFDRIFTMMNRLIQSPVKTAAIWLILSFLLAAAQPLLQIFITRQITAQEFGAYTGSLSLYSFATHLLTILVLFSTVLWLSKRVPQQESLPE